MIERKLDVLSQQFKALGNRFYQKKQFPEALIEYNKVK